MRFLLLILLFVSCTPQKRLSNLIERHPYLLRDTTITDYDTTIINVPAVHSDTIIHINTIKNDTFVIEKEHLRVQTIYRNDSIFIQGDCYGIKDTIVSVEQIKTKYVVNQNEKGISWHGIIISCLVGSLATLFIRSMSTIKTVDNSK